MLSAINIQSQLSIKPGKNQVFAIDTNALLWMFYGKSSFINDSRSRYYSGFISDLINNKNKLVITTFNLTEMLHVIEKNECDLYFKGNGKEPSLKKFRAVSSERNKVKQEIKLILEQLTAIPEIEVVSMPHNFDQIDNFCNRYNEHNCDFFDFALIEYCNGNNFSIITDDIDFSTSINNSPIYTANRKLITTINNTL